MRYLLLIYILVFPFCSKAQTNYTLLEDLFAEWRSFEQPPVFNGAPDYRQATFDDRMPEFNKLQDRLEAIDTTGWTIAQKVDWMVIWAEMNGFDFNYRVLQPWKRDPAFYKSLWTYRSDVPAHEGPTHHKTTEIWTYDFPLTETEKERLINDLMVIPPLNKQARENLTGNARELWIAGIRHIERQSENLRAILEKEGVDKDKQLVNAINDAIQSTDALVAWLGNEALKKTGPSGIGKDNYTWYQQNVHLVPLSWEDEVMILKRELARAWYSLKLEEHRNRQLPELKAVTSVEAYNEIANRAAKGLINFLDKDNIVTVKDYFHKALSPHLGAFIPKEERNFFWITVHYDPRPLYSHFYHWFELAREDLEPSDNFIRQGPLLYNIFDSRNEGVATAVEEMFMQAGLYDNDPRVREIVYIMIAQRAARGLGSLYAHANEMTMEAAGGIHADYTPRGWMKTEKELLIFEQHLYMRQPGYGTSYITGKYLFENLMAEYSRMKAQKNEPFALKPFMDELNSIGSIPITLGHWEMTGQAEILKSLSK